MIRTDLGIATAYAEAVGKGYTGTRDEFGQMFADFGKTAEKVTEDKKAVERMKTSVEETKSSVDTTAAEFGQNVVDMTAEATAAITEHANTEKESATAAISEAKDAATGVITEAQTSATDAIASAKDSATAEITKKGTDTLATIPEDYTTLTKDVSSLKEDLSEKETVLTGIQKKISDSNSNDGFLLCDLNGNIVGHIASFGVWNDEPYNKKYGWGGHPYGNGKLPPYSKIVGILEADLLSVRGGKGRWNKDDTGNFQHGGHLFEGWNAEEDARLTFGIGTKNKDISWIQTFHAATQEGTDSGAYYCVTKVGSDIDNQGMNFMPSITQSRSLFSLKVGDNLSPNSKHIQKLAETGELVDWEYNKADMIPYGTMYFDYTKDKVRVYTRTGGWKYLKFEEEV